ncbi:MAG: hypothetical protein JJT94_07900 [Bernardetiaceae bacterium]|nr:hypothetical protein [Bernardetiaceae bacterium]
MDTDKVRERKKNEISDYFRLGAVFTYFIRVFRNDPDSKASFNLRMMHGINKISILMFLFAVIFWTVKRLFF